MSTETIKATMGEFADMVKRGVETSLGEGYLVELHDMVKNNDTHRTGIIIRAESCNLAPVIYLEYYFSQYQKGEMIEDICKKIMQAYEDCRIKENFDITSFTEFEQIKDSVCFRLVNREQNQEWLSDIVYSEFYDLALVPYILIVKDAEGITSYAVKNSMLEIWNISRETLLELAMKNTPRLFRGKVGCLESIIMGIPESEPDEEDAREFYDMVISAGDEMPMYICTNECKINGAGVIFYDGLLKDFSDRIGRDFYILPSSIHETIFVPASEEMNIAFLRSMVQEINGTQVAQDEILSDNVYYYNRFTDSVEMR